MHTPRVLFNFLLRVLLSHRRRAPSGVFPGGLSLDDIDLWSRLRSLTIVKGLVFPPKVRAYLDNFAAKGDLPLYDAIAL